MNFTPFGSPFTGSIPTAAVHQFATAKFAHNMAAGGSQVVGVLSGGEGGVHYLRPVDPNGFAMATQGNNQQTQQIITLPISIAGKPGEPPQQQAVQIQVVNQNSLTNANNGTTNSPKYHISPLSLHHFPQGVLTVAYSQGQQPGEPIQLQLQQPQIQVSQASQMPISQGNMDVSNNNTQTQMQATIQHQQILTSDKQQAYPVAVVAHIPQELIMRDSGDMEKGSEDVKEQGHQTHIVTLVKGEADKDGQEEHQGVTAIPTTWQSLAAPGSTIADYLSRIPVNSLPLNLHHFLKFSAETIKREAAIESSPLSNSEFPDGAAVANPEALPVEGGVKQKKKKKYKKKAPKPRRPRPGQVHIATALDGTTLFCCPECHMAYPDKELLEQHLVGHKIERRFICDICGAGLKRKEHLERHKLGHNPDRPFQCSVCMKGFKRKEHLNLHFVIHSGEKTEVCPECGKGFYRKDHLRKHARSHITRRVKEEMSNHQQQAQQQQQHEQQQHQIQQELHQQQQGTMVTTVVLPTAAETGAMLLQHHQQQ